MKEYSSKTDLSESAYGGIEALCLRLREFYASYGYAHFKMSKFEEYDLYAANKDFLASDSIITFTDRRGCLMALKPDVTLSIIKNSPNEETSKYYYNENVYRIKRGEEAYGELLQLGVECMGNIGLYETCEIVIMAIKSLEAVSENYVLDVSSMGLFEEILGSFSLSEKYKRDIFKCVSEKSAHGIDALPIDAGLKRTLCTLIETEGELSEAICTLTEKLPEYADSPSVCELGELSNVLSSLGYGAHVRLDFSVVHDRTYYNGIVFRGFVRDVPERVLSGGRYDLLMHRMEKKSGGIGFSVYADSLERLTKHGRKRKTDVLVLKSPENDAFALALAVESLRSDGTAVFVAEGTDGIEYERLMRLDGGRLTEITA